MITAWSISVDAAFGRMFLIRGARPLTAARQSLLCLCTCALHWRIWGVLKRDELMERGTGNENPMPPSPVRGRSALCQRQRPHGGRGRTAHCTATHWVAVALLIAVQSVAVDTAHALERIAVLDFELLDVSPDPGTAREIQRTASVAPLLRAALDADMGFEVVSVDSEVQARADAAVGYLYQRPTLAAELAEQVGAAWLVIGRVHKPSPLFAYLKAQLVDVHARDLVADLVVEVKGPMEDATRRGVAVLAEQIDTAVRRRVRSE